jgi:hypothetical protein
MCGAALEGGKPAAPAKAESTRLSNVPVPLRIPANPTRPNATSDRPSSAAGSTNMSTQISGPSLLGLGSLPQSGPTLDTLRDKAFSGSPTFTYEDAQPRRGRTLLLLVILAVLAVGVWMRYRYLAFPELSKPQTASAPDASASAPGDQTPPKTTDDASSAASAQNATPPPVAEPVKPANDAATKKEDTAVEEPKAPPQTAPEKPATPAKQVAKVGAPPRIVKPVAVTKVAAAEGSGSSTFLKGEAYLYGRGVPENCEEAIRNLKAASASGNAKARSTFGTMYATGHCVPRDLPTSYSWFAKALEADPNNQVLAKDLTAIWNQMTPPERQLATKLKQ